MRLTCNFLCEECTAASVLHFQLHETGGLGGTDVSTMVSDLAGFFLNDLWKYWGSSSATSTTVDATYALIEGQPNVKKVHISDAVLGSNSTPAQAQVAGLALWDTGDPRRGGKPRTYLPFPSEDRFADTAKVAAAAITSMNGHIATFLTDVQGHTVGALVCDNLVEYSTVNKGAYRTAGAVFTLGAGSLSPFAATQRRRVDRLRSG